MGHRISAVVFQKLIERLLRNLQDRHLQVYIDDIISSENFTSAMLGVIEKLLKRLSDHNSRSPHLCTYIEDTMLKNEQECFGLYLK